MTKAADVVMVGGGVIGLASAWESATRGASVCVVDPDPGHGASWAAAGMLAPVNETTFGEEPLVRLLLDAAACWPDFAERLGAATGVDVGFRRCGTVVVALDASDRAAIDRVLEFQRRLDLPASRLSASECRALVPALTPGVRGGAHVPGDHQVDNRRLVAALLRACEAAAVQVVRSRVGAVRVGPAGDVTGVVLEDTTPIAASTVVVAAGAESAALGGVPNGVLPPVRPVKGHILRLRGDPARPLLERTVRGLVHGHPCYLVPRADGSLVVGATSEERGFDRSVQAGAVHALLDDARALVPGVDELELVECVAGLRPGSPDNRPFVGMTSLAGLAVATGHYRNGILLAPLTAAAVAALVTGEHAGPLAEGAPHNPGLSPFDAFPPDRLSFTVGACRAPQPGQVQ